MIYVLDNDPAKCAALLDDNSLGKMISAIAQVLCNVHHLIYALTLSEFCEGKRNDHIPLNAYNFGDEFSKWASECRANYVALVKMGLACCQEWIYRFNDGILFEDCCKFFSLPLDILKLHKHHYVIAWCESNKPEFSNYKYDNSDWPSEAAPAKPFPLVMPDKYLSRQRFIILCGDIEQTTINIIESYRNYYRARIWKKLKKCNSIFESPTELSGGCAANNNEVEIKWTRREKPEWLGDL